MTPRLIAASLLIAIVVTSRTADAATPYWCVCKGEKQRFLGQTYGCEVDRDRTADGSPKDYGDKRPRRCTREEFDAWVEQACAESDCEPLKE